MSTAQTWTLILGTLTVQIALLTVVLSVQSRALRNALGQAVAEIRDELHTEIGGLRTELHTEVGQVRTEQTGLASREQVQSLMVEFAELRGEIRARLATLEGGR